MFRFTIRDVLWLTVVVGLSIGWWVEYQQSRNRVNAELNKATQIEMAQMPLKDVAAYLWAMHRVPVVLGPGVDGDTPITCKIEGVSLRDGLIGILHPQRLNFQVQDGVILIERSFP